jgi:hypothetical protein
MFYQLPKDRGKSNLLLERMMRENLASQGNLTASRRRPFPVRGLTALAATKQITLNWFPPQNATAVVGFNVYRGNENTRILNIANPNTLQALIQGLTTGTAIAFYVSAYSTLLESIKTQVVATPL